MYMYVHLYSDIVITQHNGDDAPQEENGPRLTQTEDLLPFSRE
jgi:hypothetical protein